jgi:tRNA threonylcarbamoyladenosine biosynthesis protein TsaB
LILAIDTATRAMGIALHNGHEILAEHTWITRGYHTVQLAPEIALMLRRAEMTAVNLTAVAVSKGPGSYTGLRIGMALAKGLALVHNLRMVGIPTLDIVAYSQPPRAEPMLAVLEAGRGRVAGMWYKWGSTGWEGLDEPENMTWEEIQENLEETTYICGEISNKGRALLEDDSLALISPPALSVRRPGVLADLGLQKIRSGMVDDPSLLAPIYLPPRSSETSV